MSIVKSKYITDIIILDCGSTGCRLHILKKEKEKYISEEIGDKFPSLQDIANNDIEKKKFIKIFINNITKYNLKKSKLFVGITAGIRNLPNNKKKEILIKVKKIFKQIPIKLLEPIRIMTAEKESFYEKISLSYILHNCRNDLLPVIKKNKTMGHIGMGGASIQISINNNTKLCKKGNNILIPISFTSPNSDKLVDEYFKVNKFKKTLGYFYGIETIYFIIKNNLGDDFIGKPLSVKYLLEKLKIKSKFNDKREYLSKYIFIRLLENIFDKRSKIITIPRSLCSTNDECVWALGFFLSKLKLHCVKKK